MNEEFVFSFLRFLFFEKKLAPASLASYKSALGKPLEYGFGIEVSDKIFAEFSKALFLLKPFYPPSIYLGPWRLF